MRGDRGTATAALLDRHRRIVGYLNLTPKQGAETTANWARFRVEHNREEGDRSVATVAVGTRLRFRSGLGTCLQDEYTTRSGARYIELACLLTGARASSVIVGAAPPQTWTGVSKLLERTVSSVSS